MKRKPMSAVQRALFKMRRARSVDEGNHCADELARAARKDLQEVIDLYRSERANAFALVWCLQGMTDDAVLDVATHALRHRDGNVRWAAAEVLKHFSRRTLIPVFIAALKDRADMVKVVAVEWLKSHGDAGAIDPLERLSKLPRMIKHSPGTVEQAKEAVRRLRKTRNQ
jgi:HEAT repeat protein